MLGNRRETKKQKERETNERVVANLNKKGSVVRPSDKEEVYTSAKQTNKTACIRYHKIMKKGKQKKEEIYKEKDKKKKKKLYCVFLTPTININFFQFTSSVLQLLELLVWLQQQECLGVIFVPQELRPFG